MNELKIHDIKGLVEIPDYSIYLFIGIVIITIFLLLSLIYLIYKYFKNRNLNERAKYIQMMKSLDRSLTKEFAYKITQYGREVIQSDRDKKLFEELVLDLEKYKYKKEVKNFTKSTQLKIDIFMESIDV